MDVSLTRSCLYLSSDTKRSMQKAARSSQKDAFDKLAAYLIKRIDERDSAANGSAAASGGDINTLGSMAAISRPQGASGAPKDPSKATDAKGSTGRVVRQGEKACWQCGAGGLPLKKCSVCGVAWYCGPDCQKAAWKAHKIECPNLKAGKA